MDALTFIATVIGSLAWPLTVLAVVLLLRAQIVALFPALKRLKAGPVEAEFERAVEQIKKEAPPELEAPRQLPASVDARRREFLQLAAINPRAAIVEAWRGVESAAQRAGIQRIIGSPMPDLSTPLKTIRALAREGVAGPEEVALFHDLRGLRNQATHAADFSPTYEAAVDYIDLALRLEAKFESLARPDN
jgi:hypothetical protein